MAFTLSIFPWVYIGKYETSWKGEYREQEHLTPEEESKLSEADHTALMNKRNSFPDLPLVNYTSQYGMGCFEGVKGFPQKNGGMKVFRPDENAKRMARSMEGLHMPPVDEKMLVDAILGVPAKNNKLGFSIDYDKNWEKDSFLTASSLYIRPFTWSEPGIGVGLARHPWVVVIATPVSAYFTVPNYDAVTTDMVRATPTEQAGLNVMPTMSSPPWLRKKPRMTVLWKPSFWMRRKRNL